MFRRLIYSIVFTLVITATFANAIVTSITDITITRVDNQGGAPNFWLESITIGSYTVPVLRLVNGVSEGVATAQPAPYDDITATDNFDLNLFAGRATENPPTHIITEFGGKPIWINTNGDNPDFFIFETGGNQDIGIAAVLPGGTIGQSVTVPTATWGDTGLDITGSGTSHDGQSISGIAFAITDLLDQNGDNLTNSSTIEGIQINSDGCDPSCVCAVSSSRILAAYNPSPEDGSLFTETWINLSWSSGDAAVSHDVYISDNFDDVNAGAESAFWGNQTSTFYLAGIVGYAYPDGLVPGTTYFWRIDEVNEAEPNSPWKGPVWSFTVPSTKAHDPDPSDGANFVDPSATLSWKTGFGAKIHYVYFDDNFEDVNDATQGTQNVTTTFSPGIMESGKTYYWRVDEFDGFETRKGNIWSFTTIPDIPITDPNLVGWWKFDVGYGTLAIDWSGQGNNGTLTNGPKWVDGFDGGALQFDGLDDTVEFANFVPPIQGTITFWMNPVSAGPRGRIFGGNDAFEVYLENDKLANQLFAAGSAPEFLESNATITTNTWTHVALTYDGTSGLLQIYLNGNLDGENFKADDVWAGGAFAFGHRAGNNQEYYNGLLDDFRIYNIVLTQEDIQKTMRGDTTLAWAPQPADDMITEVDKALPLSFSAGEKASQHDIYFGIDKDAVTTADASNKTGIYRGRQNGTTFTPEEPVEWGTGPYYWRIDEINTDGTISKGKIWTFSVADFFLIDDFENYNAGENQIWFAWKDGLGYGVQGSDPYYAGNGTGAAVGDETTASYTEETIVHSGRQAMPLTYNNNKQGYANYSETELTLTAPRDWTEENVAELSIWFRGYPASTGSFVEAPAGTYTMTGSGSDIWYSADEFHYAFKNLTGVGTIQAQVLSVDNTDPWAKAGVMIRETLDPGSKFAAVYITTGNGCRFQARTDTDVDATSDTSVVTTEQTAITAPYWIKLERDVAGNFRGYYSANGSNWTPISWNPQNISMSSNIYIGLAVTAHNAGAVCEAKFSNVTTTGSVAGQWSHQDIGITSNDAEPLYVAVSNAAGNPAVVVNDDPAATQIDTWTEWVIPLSAFADQGINLSNVDRIAIGLGTRDNMTIPGGSGKMYFDDIRLYRSREAAE
jgi:hypothetical protein